jgi:hypothetical protein
MSCQKCTPKCIHCGEALIRSTLALILVSPAILAAIVWLMFIAMYLWLADLLKGNEHA